MQAYAGGLYALAWDISTRGFRYVTTGIVRKYVAERVLTIDHYSYFNPERPIFGPMRLRVYAAQRTGGGCSLLVIQDGYGDGADWDWYYKSVRSAWPRALRALRQHLKHSDA